MFHLLLLVQLVWAFAGSKGNMHKYNKHKYDRGLVIDAGSGGSRIHIYEWKKRIFTSLPPSVSYPTTNERWTERMEPGISSYASMPSSIVDHLTPMIEFAKQTLSNYTDDWGSYPIYFKATGGMRQVKIEAREDIMGRVRSFLSNADHNPFLFESEFARVISGEEEAIYSWAAINFLMGTLIAPIEIETGLTSAVTVTGRDTYGTLDLGGASSQIAFFLPSQDYSEGLYRLNIGGRKHWNVYAKSFLQFGHVSAYKRHMNALADSVGKDLSKEDHAGSGNQNSSQVNKKLDENSINNLNKDEILSVVDYCMFSGYSEMIKQTDMHDPWNFAGDMNGSYASGVGSDGAAGGMQGPRQQYVMAKGPLVPMSDQLDRCRASLQPLMHKERNAGGSGKLCEWVHDNQCSIAGTYQPRLPAGSATKFVGASSYKYAWKFLMMPATATLEEVAFRGSEICSMTISEVKAYVTTNQLDVSSSMIEYLPHYCFIISYTLVLLQTGYGFENNQSITVLNQVNGNKVGWPLGAILFEINSLPWIYDPDYKPAAAEVLPVSGDGALTHTWSTSAYFWCFAFAVSIAVALYAVVSMDVVRRFLYAKRQGYEPIADIEQSS